MIDDEITGRLKFNLERGEYMRDWFLPQRYDVDGREVRFSVVGTGPPLVIVHGTPWSSYNLRHLIEKLSSEFTVHCYDLIGYGQSDMLPGDVSLGIQNEILARLIDHWGLSNPPIIGHDFGGTTVLRAHLINRVAFSAMVLIDAVAISPWGSPFFSHVREHEAAFAGVPDFIHDAILRAYIATAAYEPLPDEVLENTVEPWKGELGRSAFYRQIAQADSKFTDEVQKLYRTIQSPTLILWGEEDVWIPIDRGRELHRLIPTSRFRSIPDAGHLVIEERPTALSNEIRAFFASL